MSTFDLIGSSPKFRAVLEAVESVAPVDAAVLIQGETGTGKEVIAHAIHEAQPPPPEPLRGSQLRGHSCRFAGKRTVRP